MNPDRPNKQDINQPALNASPRRLTNWVIVAIVSALLIVGLTVVVIALTTNKNNNSEKNTESNANLSNSSAFETLSMKERNSERKSDIKAIHASLEYYAATAGNGYYPSLVQLNNSQWVSTNIPDLDSQALVDPSSSSGAKVLQPLRPTKVGPYGYVTKPSSCTGSTGADPCVSYTLYAFREDNEPIYYKESLE